MKSRKNEYGILMTLGMKDTEVIRSILKESIIICILSLGCGLVAGTVLSLLFYGVVHYYIGVSQVTVGLHLGAYIITIAFYILLVVAAMIYQIIRLAGMPILELLKEKVNGEGRKRGHRAVLFLGLILMLASILVMFAVFDPNHTNIWLVSLALMFFGVSLVIVSLEVILGFLKRCFKHTMEQHCLSVAFITRHLKSFKAISFVAIWLIIISVFFSGLCAVTYPSFIHNAMAYSPYDMEYAQISGMNETPEEEVLRILQEQKVSVTQGQQIAFLRGSAFNLLKASEVNRIFDCSYQVEEGECLMLFQVDLKDGYEHDLELPDNISMGLKESELILQCVGSDIRILFNQNPAISTRTLLLNDSDYDRVAEQGNYYEPGVLKLYRFANWKNSEKAVEHLQQQLIKDNHLSKAENRYFAISSKAETYHKAQQSSQILLFMMSFVILLFCICADIMIHFKIKSEFEDEEKLFKGLQRIGITKEEGMKILYDKNLCYFLLPLPIGCLIGIFYNYVVNNLYGYGITAGMYGVLISTLLVSLQYILIKRYSRQELKKLMV